MEDWLRKKRDEAEARAEQAEASLACVTVQLVEACAESRATLDMTEHSRLDYACRRHRETQLTVRLGIVAACLTALGLAAIL